MDKDILHPKRKSFIEIGEIFFWTATINGWQNLLGKDIYKLVIVQSLQYLSNAQKIDVFAFVIMPNHIHLIWRTNALNGKETAQGAFLKYTAHEFKKLLSSERDLQLDAFKVHASNKQYEFWQRDSLAVHLFSQEVAYQKLDYLHHNPCSGKWTLAKDICDYQFSSAKYYEMGIKEFTFIKDLRDEF